MLSEQLRAAMIRHSDDNATAVTGSTEPRYGSESRLVIVRPGTVIEGMSVPPGGYIVNRWSDRHDIEVFATATAARERFDEKVDQFDDYLGSA